MIARLPEGDGVAAKYPGDIGIEEDPAVVFADGFEDIEDDAIAEGTKKQKGKKWDSTFNRLVITREPENVHSGRQAVEITHTQPANHNAVKKFGEGYDTLFVRYYMKYSKEFAGCHHTGTRPEETATRRANRRRITARSPGCRNQSQTS
jgi:hypothetical protein